MEDNNNNESLSDSFNRELEAISNESILNPAYKRKKLLLWSIRTVITITLYILFWRYNWVKWTLLLTVPLSLFSLFTIVGFPYLLKRKIERTKSKIDITEELIKESDNK